MAVLLIVFDLGVRNRGQAGRTPVDDAFALVDEPLFIQADKHLFNGFGAAFIQREALALPVAGGTELFELLDDPAAVLAFPLPGAFEEFLAAEVLLGEALLLHRLYDLRLGCDGRVVGARHPKRAAALHALEADQDILQRVVQRMSHMQLSGDVWRRDDNGVRVLGFIRFGVEIAALQPGCVYAIFDLLGVVKLVQFLFHRPISFPL